MKRNLSSFYIVKMNSPSEDGDNTSDINEQWVNKNGRNDNETNQRNQR